MSEGRQDNKAPGSGPPGQGALPSEERMLDYVEGTLSPDERRRFEAEIERHPKLVARLAVLRRDRDALRAMLRDDRAATPHGIAEGAIASAEREGLVGSEVEERGGAPAGVRRWAVPSAIAAAVLLAIGAALLFRGHQPLSDAELAAADTEPSWRIDVPEDEVTVRRDDIELPHIPGTERLISPPRVADAAGDGASTGAQRQEADEVESLLASGGPRDPGGIDWAAVLDADRPGATVREAATLAMLENVRLVVPSDDPRVWLPQRSTVLGTPDLGPDRERIAPTSPGEMNTRGEREFSIEIVVRLDEELTALQDRLFELRSKYERGEGSVGSAYFEPVASGEAQANPGETGSAAGRPVVLPSRDVDHILWWSKPTPDWIPYVSIRIPVVVTPAR